MSTENGGRVVLITGASSGIGAELGRQWARRGAAVVLAARRRERLDAIAHEIRTAGGRVLVVACDVTREGESEAAVTRAVEEWGHLDTLVANAGFGVRGTLEALTVDDYRRQFETNVFGLIRSVKAALPELRKTRGRLALIGSVAGYVASAGSGAYAASKFAVRALAQSLRHELGADGISVTHIAPGFVESEFRRKDAHGDLVPGAADDAPAWLIVPVEKAARQIVRAVERRRREAVITGHGRVIVWLERFFPWLVEGRMGGLRGSSPRRSAARGEAR